MRGLTERHGKAALAHWSISAIDLNNLCARICAAQVLSNLLVHSGTLGELVVYQGNALGPPDSLQVVVHTTVADLTPDLVLPALNPSRVAALRAAAALAPECVTNASVSHASASDRNEIPTAHRASAEPHALEVDLFAE